MDRPGDFKFKFNLVGEKSDLEDSRLCQAVTSKQYRLVILL